LTLENGEGEEAGEYAREGQSDGEQHPAESPLASGRAEEQGLGFRG